MVTFDLKLSFAQTLDNVTSIVKNSKDPLLYIQTSISDCYNPVRVVYESNQTLALESGYIDKIWKIVDLAKVEGFKIDDVISYTETGFSGTSISILVILSK